MMNSYISSTYLSAVLQGVRLLHQRAGSPTLTHEPLQQLLNETPTKPFTEQAGAIALGIDLATYQHLLQTPCPTLLQAVFENIGQTETDKKNRYRILDGQFSVSKKGLMPRKENLPSSPDYAQRWNDFVQDYMMVAEVTDNVTTADYLLQLLHRHTVTLPIADGEYADISLFDHVKTTVALAVCLSQVATDAYEPFLLVGGDLSGVQSYIYQINSKSASKSLKGRSFYLRLLTDAVVRYLLNALSLPLCHTVYNSGGSFYLLVPNTADVKQQLDSACKAIEEKMFGTHGVHLFLALDSLSLSAKTLLHSNNEQSLNEAWTALFAKRDKKKHNKYASQITERFDQFFTPKPLQNGKVDAITGDPIIGNGKSLGDGQVINLLTHRQIELGKWLKDTQYMLITHDPLELWKNRCLQIIGLPLHYHFLKGHELHRMSACSESLNGAVLVSFNRSLFDDPADRQLITQLAERGVATELNYYGGNQHDGKTFDEFCNEREQGLHRLGVLRMDVDNLGSIFQQGIQPNRSSLSRFSALSRSLDVFFSGYINAIQQEVSPRNSFIVYSGGDDLFIVGDWKDCINLAERIHTDFKQYTCHNPRLSVSGGIAIVPPKFPIMKGAEYSDDEEKRAKKHTANEQEKNSLSLMNFPLHWTEEFPRVKELKDQLVRLIKDGKIPTSFIGKVLQHHANSQIENHQIKALKTYWMVAYDLGRFIERMPKESEARQLIETCQMDILDGKSQLGRKPIATAYHPLELWSMVCRWAELENRSNE